MQSTIGAIGTDIERPIRSGESTDNTSVFQRGAIEIAEHCRFGCLLHRQRMVRAAPEIHLRLVTFRAGLTPDEFRLRLCAGFSRQDQREAQRDHKDQIGQHGSYRSRW